MNVYQGIERRTGLWFIAGATRPRQGARFDVGAMLSGDLKSWLLSGGIYPGRFVGVGWTCKEYRR